MSEVYESDYKSWKLWVWVMTAVVAALIVAGVCFLTKPAEEYETQETTVPVETSEPSLWLGVDEETAAYLTAQFTDPTSWYYMALCDDYISPEYMSPTMFFDSGTDGEKVFFTDADYDAIGADVHSRYVMDASYHKLDHTRANQILWDIFGITMSDFRHPNNRVMNITYYEELDCWSAASCLLWWEVGDGIENSVEILGGQSLENGDIAITYTDGRNCRRVVTVRNTDGVWKVRSNLMASDIEAYSTDFSSMELPWDVPESMSYEQYFSEYRAYTDEDQYGWSGTGWLTDYTVECDGCQLVVRENSKKSGANGNINSPIVWVIQLDLDFTQSFIRYRTQEYLFGVKGNEVFRVDYYGNYETLFLDETGMLAQKHLGGVQWVSDAVDQTIWFVAGVNEGEPHPGIYRIYMPTGQVDLVYDDFPSYAEGVDENGWGIPEQVRIVYSNQEVVWYRDNDAFWAYYNALVDDETSVLYTDPKYSGYELSQEVAPAMMLADELDVDPWLACYFDISTGYYYQEGTGRMSSDLTFDQIDYDGSRWWEK